MKRFALILFVGVVIAIIAAAWPVRSHLQKASTGYSVELKLKEFITLPCSCNPVSRATGREPVSVSTDAEQTPFNYRYSVTGGKIVGAGPNVVWDFIETNDAPGKYSITVEIDDGLGNSATKSKTVEVVETDCNCQCSCPTLIVNSPNTAVSRGGELYFEADVAGGAAKERGYNWTVTNGTIDSGQDTSVIRVRASSDKHAKEVTATLDITLDVDCDCPKSSSESVPIGKSTILKNKPSTVEGLYLDETTLYLDCPRRYRSNPRIPGSKDLVIDVSTAATSNSLREELEYTYSVSGGSIIGSGRQVKWDLVGLAPGTYNISVAVSNGRGLSEPLTRTITLAERDCIQDPVCPSMLISSATRVGTTDDYIVRARAQGGSGIFENLPYSWEISGGNIIAGQGTRSVRVRARWGASDPVPEVKVSLVFPSDVCTAEKSLSLSNLTPL